MGSSLVDIEIVSETVFPEKALEVVVEGPGSLLEGLGEQPPSFSREARLPPSYDKGIIRSH